MPYSADDELYGHVNHETLLMSHTKNDNNSIVGISDSIINYFMRIFKCVN